MCFIYHLNQIWRFWAVFYLHVLSLHFNYAFNFCLLSVICSWFLCQYYMMNCTWDWVFCSKKKNEIEFLYHIIVLAIKWLCPLIVYYIFKGVKCRLCFVLIRVVVSWLSHPCIYQYFEYYMSITCFRSHFICVGIFLMI